MGKFCHSETCPAAPPKPCPKPDDPIIDKDVVIGKLNELPAKYQYMVMSLIEKRELLETLDPESSEHCVTADNIRDLKSKITNTTNKDLKMMAATICSDSDFIGFGFFNLEEPEDPDEDDDGEDIIDPDDGLVPDDIII